MFIKQLLFIPALISMSLLPLAGNASPFSFVGTGSMGTARSGHTATPLHDGTVLVAGGRSGSVCVSSAEIYDPSTGTWTATGSMAIARDGHTATQLPNGKVLVAGGSRLDNGIYTYASAELYDPSSGKWTATGSMLAARCLHTATLLPNGKVLVAGGYCMDGNINFSWGTAELYDPSTGTWTATGSLVTARFYHTATLLADGQVLVTGGNWSQSGSGGYYHSSAELYDPSTGTWSATGSMGTARTWHSATLLSDCKVFVAGGYDFSGHFSSSEVYDPSDGSWKATGSMGTARACHTATPLPDGKVLVAGGTDGRFYLSSCEIFNPSDGTWTATGSMGTARSCPTATLLHSGRVLLAGGGDGNATVSSAELYGCLVTFDAAGGQVCPASECYYSDSDPYGPLPVPTLPPPAPVRVDFNFAGWFTGVNGSGEKITDATTLAQTSDHTLYAKWTAAPYACDPAADVPLSSAGEYAGYFYNETPYAGTNATAVRGLFALTLANTNGRLSAKAQLQNGQISFRANAWTSRDADGTRRVNLSARSGETLDLYVRQNRLWGSLSGGSINGEAFSLDGSRNSFVNRKDTGASDLLESYKGYYTIALPPYAADPVGAAQTTPEGSGYLTLTVGSRGLVKIAGMLADGTSVSQSSTLILFNGCGPQACVPFFVPVYAHQGWTGGLLWFTPGGKSVVTTDLDLGWFVRWEKPAGKPDGASVLLNAVGGYYSTIPALAAHYLLTAGTNTVRYYYDGGTARLKTEALPDGIGVTLSGNRLTITQGTLPVRTHVPDSTFKSIAKLINTIPIINHAVYDYSAENSAMATFSFTPRTGIFRGLFNLYYDSTQSRSSLLHITVRVPFAGVLTPVRGENFAAEPAGQGYYLVPDNAPLWRTSNLKRSYRITLDESP